MKFPVIALTIYYPALLEAAMLSAASAAEDSSQAPAPVALTSSRIQQAPRVWRVKHNPEGEPTYLNRRTTVTQSEIPPAVAAYYAMRRDVVSGTLVYSEDSGFSVYLGDAHDALDATWLQSKGIGAVLNMMDMSNRFHPEHVTGFLDRLTDYQTYFKSSPELEAWYRNKLHDPNFMYLNIPTNDVATQVMFSYFPQAVEFIQRARERGVNILVHCFAGQSRSAAIVTAWILQSDPLMSLRNAILQVHRARSEPPSFIIMPHGNFIADLVRYCLETLGKSEEQCTPPNRDWRSGWA